MLETTTHQAGSSTTGNRRSVCVCVCVCACTCVCACVHACGCEVVGVWVCDMLQVFFKVSVTCT